MPTYRAYRLDADRQFRSGVWLDARNDADAVNQAEDLCDPATPYVEVRTSTRVVDEIECDEAGANESRSGSRDEAA